MGALGPGWRHLVLVGVLAACRGERDATAPFPLVARVLRAVQPVRPFALRLADGTAYVACPPADTASIVPPATCAPLTRDIVDSLAALTTVVVSARRTTPTTDALWAQALLDLLDGSGDPRRLDRVIARLQEVRVRAPSLALIANHLAIAFMARARARGDVSDLFDALDHAEQASALDSLSPALRFNRALLHGMMGTVRRARQEWERASAVERDAPWRAEGERRRASLPGEGARPFERVTRETVASDPQGAREFALDTLLPRWGRATVAGDADSARTIAEMLQLAGEQLLAQHGDSSAWHVAREMQLAGIAPLVAAVARGNAAYTATRYDSSATILTDAVAALRRAGAVASADWGALRLGATRMQQRRYEDATRHLSAIADRARARGDRALLARTLWASGVLVGRSGDMEDAERRYVEAREIFLQLGEGLNAAQMKTGLADMQGYLGRFTEAATSAYVGFNETLRHGGLVRYENLLLVADHFGGQGKRHAAVHYLSEAALIAATSPRVKDLPEVLGRLALALVALGRREAAGANLARARAMVGAVEDSAMRSRLVAELDRTELQLVAPREPARALQLVDAARRHFASNPPDDAPLLYARAQLQLQLGDSAAAVRDLAASIRLTRSQASGVSPAEARALVATLRGAHRTLIAVALARGDTATAYDETVRLPSIALREDPVSAVPTALTRGRGELRFVMLEDRVLTWLRTAGAPAVAVAPIGGDSLRAMLVRFINVVRSGDDTLAARRLGHDFFRLFVAPHERQLAGVAQLDVHADGALGDLTLAALVDDAGRYLGERLAIEYVVPAGRRRAAGAKSASAVPLLVGDPAWRREEHPGLEPLRWAEEEVRQVAALYPKARVLSGAAATKAALLAELPRHAVLHFAGHSRVVVEQPETSHLVLAAGGTFADGVLTAAEIARLDLRGVELVVLSSCGRTRDDAGSLGEVNALAVAFLDAGVGRVVASGWEVEDANNTDPIAVELHANRRRASGVPHSPTQAAKGHLLVGAVTVPRVLQAYVARELHSKAKGG